MKNTFAKMFTVCALAGVLGFALTACDDSSSASGDNGRGGNRGGIPDTVETFMELSDYDCGKSQKCVATYLTEYHDMAVCDGNNGWVIGTLIEKMDCDFSSSSAKSSDSKSNDLAEVTDDSSDSKGKPSSAGTSTKSSASKEPDSSGSEGVEDSSASVPGGSSDSSVYDSSSNTLTDLRDGLTYKTVKIGTQTWMAENLNYETGNSYCYNDNCTKYGRLYTWAAAMDSAGTWSANGKGCGYEKTCSPTYPVRGVCPKGWHLPSQSEWEALIVAVDGSITEYTSSNTAGSKLKSVTGWYDDGNGEDTFGFSALPAGYRDINGDCYYEGNYAYFWSSTEYLSYYAYYMRLYYGIGYASLYNYYKNYGLSVRCVKDPD